jgi:hypothetical protein
VQKALTIHVGDRDEVARAGVLAPDSDSVDLVCRVRGLDVSARRVPACPDAGFNTGMPSEIAAAVICASAIARF